MSTGEMGERVVVEWLGSKEMSRFKNVGVTTNVKGQRVTRGGEGRVKKMF